jgi:hypothetical protein
VRERGGAVEAGELLAAASRLVLRPATSPSQPLSSAPFIRSVRLAAWQDAGAIDGFTIMGSTLPYELTAFVDHVVPILQRRGRFRTEYTGDTLRDHLGLLRPSTG